jgi:O-antigen/teichoic acid export membrane protein
VSEPAGGRRALLTASAAVTAATVVINLLAYAVIAVATRMLAPQGYGALAALLGLAMVGAVPASTMQVVLARRVAVGAVDGLAGAAVRTAFAVLLLAVAAAPLLHSALSLDLASLLALAAALPAMALSGAIAGVAQGRRRFGLLAALIALAGVGRNGGTITGLALTGTPAGAMAGMAVGSLLTFLASVPAVRGPSRGGSPSPEPRPGREVARATVTMLALAVLLTLDVLLAKRYLPETEAGWYGAGAVVTKATLWLPYAVTMIALPRLAVAAERARILRVAVAVLAGLGVVEVLGVLILGPVLFPLFTGGNYDAVTGSLWLFAVEGAILAVAQLVALSRIAATDRLIGPLLWAAVVAEAAVIALAHGSIGTILTIATVSAAVTATAGLALPPRPATRWGGARRDEVRSTADRSSHPDPGGRDVDVPIL